MAGRIQIKDNISQMFKYKEDGTWDYLHINNSNMAGAKSNIFVTDEVTKDTKVHGDGTVTTSLVVKYNNPHPGSDCGLESGGLCLNAPLRNWIRVYVPLGSTLTDSKGGQSPKDNKAAPFESYDDLGKTVFEGFLIINPQGTAQFELTYTSPVKPAESKYPILIQKQPGTEGSEFTLKIDGKTKEKKKLITDMEFIL